MPGHLIPVQNRFSVLNSTVRDTDDDFTHTVLDDAGVEVFPMTDDASVQVPIEPPRHRPYRRLVLIPQPQGTPHSVQDRQSDESEGDHIHAPVRAPSTDGVRSAGEVDPRDGDGAGDEDTESLRGGTDRDGDSEVGDNDSGPIAEIDPGPPLPTVSPARAAIAEGIPTGQFRLRPISTSANFDFGQLAEVVAEVDDVDCGTIFSRRAAVMKTVPKFLWGSFRVALKVALEEITEGADSRDIVRQERGWKLLFLLPRMLLHRPPRGGQVGRAKLISRFEKFSSGNWLELVMMSEVCSEQAAVAFRRQSRRRQDDTERRIAKAHQLVQMGEISFARQALEGAALAPGTRATLDVLRDPSRRPNLPREPVPDIPANASAFELDEDLFTRNLRTSRKGAAGGPSGMTTEHLRTILGSPPDTHLLFRAGELLARAQVPNTIVDIIRVGRLTALSKPDGGVRGIVAGDVIRRLVAKTMARQLTPAVEAATVAHQCALSTRAGCECVAHSLQMMCETDPELTITSVDGVSAFDLISRRAMLEGLANVEGGPAALSFVHMFYGRPSTCLWEDVEGTVHTINQGEGGEQGDALMCHSCSRWANILD